MELQILAPSYLEKNHQDTLRYELCEIIYSIYKYTTFRLDKQLNDKKHVLKELYVFLKQHPEIEQHKNDSGYWYPYENVDGSKNLKLHTNFYPNTSGEITFFSKEDNYDMKNYDYLVDPVKLQFFLMCNDVSSMDTSSTTAQQIIHINNQLFQMLHEVIGDTISYNNKNTLQHVRDFLNTSNSNHQEVASFIESYILKDELEAQLPNNNKPGKRAKV